MLAPLAWVEDYEIERFVTVGAMCDVYEARTRHLGRSVAVKVLHETWCTNDAMVTRFENEANMLRAIRHPNVVCLLSAGKLATGEPYMVLEWMPQNLATALTSTGGALGYRTAVRIASQIASALTALHDAGVVHRDLKPANVLLDRDDLASAEVRLADLGLAKARPGTGIEPIPVGYVSTGGSARLGTWDYMAPEQWIKSKSADPKADVYSLGVLLFQMLAGRLPFVAEQAKDLMALHLFEDPPMARLSELVPAHVKELVGRMLKKTPSMRPVMVDVIGELAEVR